MAVNNEINISLKAKDNASDKLENLGKSAGGLGGKLKALGGPLAAIGTGLATTGVAVGVVGYKFYNMGADIEQTMNKAHIVFGEYFDDVKKVSDETAKAMGLSTTEYMKAAAGIQDLLIPMGFTREEASKNTTELMGLSGALAEWSAGQYNASQVGEILASAMLGEREQLKSLGIAISAEEVGQRVLLNAKNGVTFATQQQSNAFATQQLIFEKSTDAQTAYANGAESLTRKKAELTATLKNVQDTMATALIPAFVELIKTMQPVIEKVAQSISLWFQNKENVDKLTGTIQAIIGVFGTLFNVIGTIISILFSLGGVIGEIAFKITSFVITTGDLFIKLKDTTVSIFSLLKDLVLGIFEAMKQAIIEKFQAAIDFVNNALSKVQAVWNKVSSAVSSVKNAASSVASNVGNFISGTKANGGSVSAGNAYLVGERGSEIFVPSTNGQIVSGGGFGNISINMGGVSVSNSADENRLVEKIKRELTNSLQMSKFGIS